MKIIPYPDPLQWNELVQRPVTDLRELEKPVQKIIEKVKAKGDKAVRKLSLQFDGVKLKDLEINAAEFAAAEAAISDDLKNAIHQAKKNIETFHSSQLITGTKISTLPGVECWQQTIGIQKVGLYIPGGSAPLFSTVLMLAIPAKLAGCRDIILCSPPNPKGELHPAILFAAQLCGVTRIFKVGGVQAIAAMAYGTASIPKVFKIFGPGNQYVTMAKQLVQKDAVAIDMPAGPSEVLVIADESANPSYVAADLLSQAEHGADSQAILLCTSEKLVEQVQSEIKQQLEKLPRQNIAAKALEHSRIILFKDSTEAIAFSNQYAPEHLIIATRDAREIAGKVKAAGSVFIGHYSPESAGDYASGTNHTLPTNGYAAMYSGVSVNSFSNTISFQELSREGLTSISKTVMTMAAAEGLEAHREAVAIRLNT